MKAALHILVACLVLMAGPVLAGVSMDRDALPPEQEQRAQTIMRELRCLVCQNESIADSNADLAHDLRRIVRERVVAGDSDSAVRAYLVRRYGDWILLDPPFKASTLLLWLSPLAILLLSGVALIRHQRRRAQARGNGEMPPLDAAERARLDQALADDR